jgi:hypothetical protein
MNIKTGCDIIYYGFMGMTCFVGISIVLAEMGYFDENDESDNNNRIEMEDL